MKMIRSASSKFALFLVALLCMAQTASAGVLDAAVVTAIDDGETAATAVLTAAVAIVGLFILWRVIKRAGAKV